MRVAIGCDHAGFTLKAPLVTALEADGHDVLDLGTFSTDPVDYPDFAKSVGQAVLRGFVEVGVLVCGSGVGASIAANKLRGVRAALCHDLFTARQSREDDDANLLCLGARVLDESAAVGIMRAWLEAQFTAEERHVRRVAKIAQIEATGAPAGATAAPAPPRAAAPAAAPAPPPAPPPRVAPPAPPAPAPPPRPVSMPAPAAPPRPAPVAAAARAASPPAAPIPPAPPAPVPPPRPAETTRRVDPLAAQAEELFRQFAERHPEDKPAPAKREGVISLDEDEATIEVEMPEPKARRPEPKAPAGRAAAEAKTPPPGRAPAESKGRAAEGRRAAAHEVTSPAAAARPAAPTEPELPPLPDAFKLAPVREAVSVLENEDFLGRIWVKDVELWNGDVTGIRNRLGWLTAPTIMEQNADDIRTFADEIRRLYFSHVVLLGMGGSSLASEVFALTFGSKMGFPDLLILDSTDPAAVRRTLERINLAKTLFVVATKSGTTLETLCFHAFFRSQVDASKAPKPGQQFVAITDPGAPLEKMAADLAFRRVFLNPPTIGGRYSALSFFGLVPAALIGVDVRILLERAQAMVEACGRRAAVKDNPGVMLGAAIAGFAKDGRDKITLVFSEKLRALGPWIEQLVAESLGKEDVCVVPVDDEPLGPPAVYGDDRVFVAVVLEDDRSHHAELAKLAAAGHPVIRLAVKDAFDVAGEFFRWELATATAAALLGVNPFDEPDVTAAKEKTATLLAAWKKSRRLPEWRVAAETDSVALMMPPGSEAGSVAEGLARHLAQGQPGDYVAFLAYVAPHPDAWSRLQEIRTLVRDRYHLATTVAYGPRYLHSTGQLHKGGPPKGVLIQITGEDAEDPAIPGAGYGFGTLKAAQALGDLETLAATGRRVIRLHLRGKPLAALEKLTQLFRSATRKV